MKTKLGCFKAHRKQSKSTGRYLYYMNRYKMLRGKLVLDIHDRYICSEKSRLEKRLKGRLLENCKKVIKHAENELPLIAFLIKTGAYK